MEFFMRKKEKKDKQAIAFLAGKDEWEDVSEKMINLHHLLEFKSLFHVWLVLQMAVAANWSGSHLKYHIELVKDLAGLDINEALRSRKKKHSVCMFVCLSVEKLS